MGPCIKEASVKIRSRDMVSSIEMTRRVIKAIGWRIKCMAKASWSERMGRGMWVTFLTIKKREVAVLSGRMEGSIMDSGGMGSRTERGNISTPQVVLGLDSGMRVNA